MATNQKIAVSFNQAMDAATINTTTFTLQGPSTTPVTGTVSYDATNNIATFTPTNPLAASTTFTGTITTGAQSAGGTPLASAFVWTFVTSAGPNTTVPIVLSTNPANLAINVATNQRITATFSQAMDSTTVTTSTFTVTAPGPTTIPGTVLYSAIGATAVFTPTNPLPASELLTATITTGATDLAGNPLATAHTWTFTTGLGPDSIAPTVTLTTPAAGATAVASNAAVNATFSKAMDPSTLNPASFMLNGPGPTLISGKITYDPAGSIVTFTPASALANSTLYNTTITTGAADLEGNPLSAAETWSFTTGTAPSLSPINLGAASGFGVLAQAAITNTGATLINGDVGLSPGTSITGLPAADVNGTIYAGTGPGAAPAIAALASLNTAFNDAIGLPGASVVGENLAGQTLTPGLYTAAATSFEITGGNLTLNAQGDPNAIWIFQMPSSTLTLTTPTCSVILENGAQFSNIYWIVGSSATVGVSCVLEGNVLADTSITLNTGATLQGRALGGAVTSSGAVSLDDTNLSSVGGCSQ